MTEKRPRSRPSIIRPRSAKTRPIGRAMKTRIARAARRALGFAVFLFSSLLAIPVPAATITWIGATNATWSKATNWDLGRAPVDGDDVFIPRLSPIAPSNQDLVGVKLHSLSVDGSSSLSGNPLGLQSGGSINFGAAASSAF